MSPRPITHQNIFRVLLAGFGLVILLLLAAAVVGLRNIDSIQQSAANLVREQSVTNRLIAELHTQQSSLSDVFSILARDPDSVDYDRIMNQLAEADRDIDRIATEGAQTPERELWTRLRQTSADFSNEARRILSVENLETFRSLDLFRDHEAFIAVVARLIEAEYRKVTLAQAQIDERSRRLLDTSFVFAGASVLLALIFALVTIRMVARLIRQMDSQTAELGRVSWHMLEDQEATARRFSHELHDELGQSLTAVKTNLAALDPHGNVESGRLQDCLRLVDDAIGNVRQMSQLLRPTILDDFGLEAGVRWLAEGFSARTGIEVDFDSKYSGRLPDETETHLFRIAQEALTNVARHAGAHHVRMRLESENGEICLCVQDDGRGLKTLPAPSSATVAAGRPASLGMSGMRVRARSAGGELTVRSRPGEGVLIEVRVPLKNETHTNPAS
ncbi:MAG TPA: sensor histidine kinase [Candidatus Sulfopaludibacter sp.]|jgi:signal transduction histidine kinase|nr:sensor histidine kinase [Candidatus Sulfopaludibacter sp.]